MFLSYIKATFYRSSSINKLVIVLLASITLCLAARQEVRYWLENFFPRSYYL